MKNFLSVMLFISVLIVVGCSSSDYSGEVLLKENAGWVETKENARDFRDALETGDEDFFKQQFLDGKIKVVDKETKVMVMTEIDGGKIVQIKFLQGRYKNRVGFTIPESFVDMKKRKEREEYLEEKKKVREDIERVRNEQISDDEKERYDLLIQSGIDIALNPVRTLNGSYREVSGITNLIEGTLISISISNVQGKVAIWDGGFSFLFDGSGIPLGKQKLIIRTLDKNAQPLNIQNVDEIIFKMKGSSILDKVIFNREIQMQ